MPNCPDCEQAQPEAGTKAQTSCAFCGVRLQPKPLAWKSLASDLAGSLVSLEFPVLRTVRDLLRNPGRVASDWICGKRQTYLHPLKFLIIVGAVMALLYQPLSGLRYRLNGSGTAIYSVGIARYASQFLAFFLLFLALLAMANEN